MWIFEKDLFKSYFSTFIFTSKTYKHYNLHKQRRSKGATPGIKAINLLTIHNLYETTFSFFFVLPAISSSGIQPGCKKNKSGAAKPYKSASENGKWNSCRNT